MTLARVVEALGWTLLHSCWQLAAIGLVAAVLFRALPGDRIQHRLAWIGLWACLLLPMLTLIWMLRPLPEVATQGFALPGAPWDGGAAPLAASGPLPWRLEAFARTHIAWVAVAWALGVLAQGLRLTGGLFTARRWRLASASAPAPWQTRFAAMAARLGASARVRLRLAQAAATPFALGLWRPVVILPAALLTDLPAAYVEALLAHELAHVRRHDYILNLLQSVIEGLLFHHPVVWWLSRRIRTAREHLADDLAATAIGEPRRLALALDALDDFKAVRPTYPHLAPAASGGTLFARIHRLVAPSSPRPRPAWLPLALLALALPATALTLKAATNPPIPGEPALIAELDALAAKEGIDPQLLRSMAWVESGLRRKAKSPHGAVGVLQVMPETARKYGATDVNDPAQVAAAGAKYLRFLLDRYPGDTAKAVAAYNGGEKAIDAGKLSEETKAYAPLVMSVYQAKAVQAAPTLPEGGVDGVVRALPDGRYQISFRISARSGIKLEVVEDGAHGAPLGSISMGTEPGKVSPKWTISSPVLTIRKPMTNTLVFRSSDEGIGITGETRITLDAPWKTFAFTMKPKG